MLVLRAQCGDREALSSLLTLLGPELRRYLWRLSGKEDLADDLTQETMIVVCKKLKWLREPQLLRPWSFRIASRLAFRQIRKDRSTKSSLAHEYVELEDPKAAASIIEGLETISEKN